MNYFNKQIIKGDSDVCVLRITFDKTLLLYEIIAEKGGCLAHHGNSKVECLIQARNLTQVRN